MMDALRPQLEKLPEYLSGHVLLTVVALSLGILLSVPLALLVVRAKRLRGPVLTGASIIQTIPSLALLALMVPLLGGTIGRLPAIVALLLYSILPILRNTVTGILNVDRAILEAARGIGMTPNQILVRVQLPLALPVIVAGIRTATVWVVGIATLSTPVGATSLGNYIFSGLQTRTWAAVYVGCVASALLAITLDGLVRLIERAIERRSRRLGVAAGSAVVLILGAGLAPLVTGGARADSSGRPMLVIGAKTFTEQYILAGLLEALLEEKGFRARPLESLGSTIVFDALRSGEVDAYVDYSGTIWANQMKREDNPGREAVYQQMSDWLLEEHGIRAAARLGFENAYAFAMRRTDSERLGIRDLNDLARHSGNLRLAGDYEFFSRPEWQGVREAYSLEFRDRRSLDSTLMYEALNSGQVDVISAFSTDGRIAAYDFVVIEDPRGALPPYDAVLLVSPRAGEDETLLSLLTDLNGRIGNAEMRTANMLVDVEKQPIDAAVEYLRREIDSPTR